MQPRFSRLRSEQLRDELNDRDFRRARARWIKLDRIALYSERSCRWRAFRARSRDALAARQDRARRIRNGFCRQRSFVRDRAQLNRPLSFIAR